MNCSVSEETDPRQTTSVLSLLDGFGRKYHENCQDFKTHHEFDESLYHSDTLLLASEKEV
jgi:hypothetical protein